MWQPLKVIKPHRVALDENEGQVPLVPHDSNGNVMNILIKVRGSPSRCPTLNKFSSCMASPSPSPSMRSGCDAHAKSHGGID